MATTDPILLAAAAGPVALPASSSPVDKIEAAARMYLRRKHRLEHPDGEFDSGGRWFPDDGAEKKRCCASIRWPSRAHPYSLLVHCRTLEHVCRLLGVDGEDHLAVRRRARELELSGDDR